MDNERLSYLGIIILVIILFIGVFGIQKCEDNNADYQATKGNGYNIEIIDSCEYLVRYELYAGYMAHKGNCKFCEERRKKNENR